MLSLAAPLHSLRRQITAAARDQRGISAVEFALLLPLMITLYLGGVEVTQAVSIDRKLSMTARTVADLVAQGTTISNTEMTNILNAAKAVASPYPQAPLKVVVSSIKIDSNKVAKVAWSDATSNATKRQAGQTVTLPAGLDVADTYLIWAEVNYTYTPAIGYVITGPFGLADQIYMRPRLNDKVCREGVTCT